ncbi:MAG: ribosome maturation factor RimP [Elusimicrobia bacterium]|nr:ribosome maturation factor RimP [Elusimicrobiota bacterium]
MDLNRIEKELEGVLALEAAELVDVRYVNEGGRWVLRLFIDRPGGVTIDDCERVSGRVGAFLDASDMMTHAYTLEVSSPGLDRVLKKDKDFERFTGHRVRVALRAPLDGRRRFSGFLRGVEGGQVVLENEGAFVRLDRAGIEEARLDPEIEI